MRDQSKSELRKAARERRAALAAAVPDFARRVAEHAVALRIAQGAIVGGYHALPEEADPQLLLAGLARLGCRIAFPRVVAEELALDFHLVPPGEALAPGSFGIHEPLHHWPRVEPDVLLVPLLAFDASGNRIGYGGGYYDRTLALYTVPAIGVAYAGQRVDLIPCDASDCPLDAVVTELGVARFTTEAG